MDDGWMNIWMMMMMEVGMDGGINDDWMDG
jgi:hypothetical protein